MDVNINYGSFPKWRVMLQDNEGNGNICVQLEKATLKSDLPFRPLHASLLHSMSLSQRSMYCFKKKIKRMHHLAWSYYWPCLCPKWVYWWALLWASCIHIGLSELCVISLPPSHLPVFWCRVVSLLFFL